MRAEQARGTSCDTEIALFANARPENATGTMAPRGLLVVLAASLAMAVLVGCAQSGAGSRPLIPQLSSTSQQGTPGSIPQATATPVDLPMWK